MASKTADAIKLVLRLPKALHKRLTQQARRNNVSLNTEIVQRLKETLPTAKTHRDLREVADLLAQRGANHALGGTPLTEMNKKLDKLIAAVDIGPPVQRHSVIPLRNPISETPEPKVPLPKKKTEPESETVKSDVEGSGKK